MLCKGAAATMEGGVGTSSFRAGGPTNGALETKPEGELPAVPLGEAPGARGVLGEAPAGAGPLWRADNFLGGGPGDVDEPTRFCPAAAGAG